MESMDGTTIMVNMEHREDWEYMAHRCSSLCGEDACDDPGASMVLPATWMIGPWLVHEKGTGDGRSNTTLMSAATSGRAKRYQHH